MLDEAVCEVLMQTTSHEVEQVVEAVCEVHQGAVDEFG